MEKKVLQFCSNSQKVPDKQKKHSKVATIPFEIFKCLYRTKELTSLWLEMQREVNTSNFQPKIYIFFGVIQIMYQYMKHHTGSGSSQSKQNQNKCTLLASGQTNCACCSKLAQIFTKKSPKCCQKYQKRSYPSQGFNKEL